MWIPVLKYVFIPKIFHIFKQEMRAHYDKINEMATVMKKAIEVDEERQCEDEERIKQLEVSSHWGFHTWSHSALKTNSY